MPTATARDFRHRRAIRDVTGQGEFERFVLSPSRDLPDSPERPGTVIAVMFSSGNLIGGNVNTVTPYALHDCPQNMNQSGMPIPPAHTPAARIKAPHQSIYIVFAVGVICLYVNICTLVAVIVICGLATPAAYRAAKDRRISQIPAALAIMRCWCSSSLFTPSPSPRIIITANLGREIHARGT